MQRFYQFIKDVHHEDFDVARAAKLDVNRWIIHRSLFGNSENQELVDALTDLYAEAYGVEPARVKEATRLRGMGMLYSDLWASEACLAWGVNAYPDLEAAFMDGENLRKMDWGRYLETETILGISIDE